MKSNVVHFRPNSVKLSDYVFKCGISTIEYSDRYVYLGVTLTEHIDFNITAKIVAQSAGRALGLLIAKFKNNGGFPFDVYSKLYYSCVVPIITYGAAVCGTRSFSCINEIHHRAMRFFLGTGNYTPIAAVYGDMGWKPIIVDQWKSVCNHWNRCLRYDVSRINKKVFDWAAVKGNNRCRNWAFAVKDKWLSLNLNSYLQLPFSYSKLVSDLTDAMFKKHVELWKNDATVQLICRNFRQGNILPMTLKEMAPGVLAIQVSADECRYLCSFVFHKYRSLASYELCRNLLCRFSMPIADELNGNKIMPKINPAIKYTDANSTTES
ncbi:hypothetical protein MAR_028017 [Mya arenaria]|uniref:Uncharacterized protein n=1 Tax=Mya arenaria TaxID=6604 RepID=A0ABY7DF14_MYAAR|nr:hypothetical protein MAR_028017 [Mya arenaria]